MPHLLGALVVALFIMIVGAFVTHQFRDHTTLRPLAMRLMTVTGVRLWAVSPPGRPKEERRGTARVRRAVACLAGFASSQNVASER